MKKDRMIAVVLICALLAVSCGKNERTEKDSTATDSVSENTTDAGNSGNSDLLEDVYNTDDDFTVIKWAMPNLYLPDEDICSQINDIIEESGIAVKIDFIGIGSNLEEENEIEIDKYEEQNGTLDIITTGGWLSQYGSSAFAAGGYFYCLDDYLLTDEGAKLYSSFAPIDWERTSVDGKNYTVPKVSYSNYDSSVFISVNNDYVDYFSEFDGTYEALADIYNEIDNENLKIVYENLDLEILYALSGYGYYDKIAVDENGNLCQTDEIDNFSTVCEGISEDLAKGTAESKDSHGDVHEENVLAYIYTGANNSERDGMTAYLISGDCYSHKCGYTYGVRSKSENIDLSLQVLTEFYSNKKIVELVNGISEEEIDNRKEYMENIQGTVFTDFVFESTSEQTELMQEYVEALFDLPDAIKGNNGISDILSAAGDDYYQSLFDDMNDELDDWTGRNAIK
jgi:hypothetical protein